MNWEAAVAIGEILAAIAVVATLLYLSRELRQNLRSQSITTLRDTTALWSLPPNWIQTWQCLPQSFPGD